MRVAITGACGFVGSNLIESVLPLGWDLVLLDNFSTAGAENLPEGLDNKIVEADVRNLDSLSGSFDGVDIVFHLAASGSVVDSVSEPGLNFKNNVIGTFNVLEAAKESDVRKVIFASTGGALIGNAEPPVTENSVPRPISPYGASKLAGEGYCSAFAEAYSMDITSLRFANIVGPRSMHKKGAVTTFFKSLSKNEPINIFGDGSSTRDYLDVKDLCDGLITTAQATLSGFNVFHLSSGTETSIKKLAGICCEITGRDESLIRYKGPRPGEVDRNFADFSRINKKIGWAPKRHLRESLEDTWSWMQKHI